MYIFAYGSLIWKPNFNYFRKFKGTLKNYKRDYSIIETHHRGTPFSHGLALGIHSEKNNNTEGFVFQVDKKYEKETLDYLRQRENPDKSNYIEKYVDIETDFGTIKALTFIINKKNKNFFKINCPKTKANIIKNSKGLSGTNLDYFEKNLKSLSESSLIDNNDIHFQIKKSLS